MAMRPAPARWFELLTLKSDLSSAMQALAATHAVQLETHSEPAATGLLPELQAAQSEFGELRRRYLTHWPEPQLRRAVVRDDPSKTLAAALARIRAWQSDCESLIRDIEQRESGRTRLLRLGDLLDAASPDTTDIGRIAAAGPVLAPLAYELGKGQWPRVMPASILARRITGAAHDYLIGTGLAADVARLGEELDAMKGRPVPLPEWLRGDPAEWRTQYDRRIASIDAELEAARSQLAAHTARHELAYALGDLELVQWLDTHLYRTPCTENFAWIVGWTSDTDGARLHAALRAAGARYLLRFPKTPPPGFEPPVLFANPTWARPFELFARLLGMPGASEADPSRLLAIIAPLLFGFMFGDVGHGLAIAIIGLALRRRFPATTILVSGGIVSMAFGVAFGSVFAQDDVIPALWLHPLDAPLTILVASLGLGGLIIVLGLALGALSASWLGQFGVWVATRGGLTLAYLSAWGMVFDPRAGWLMAAGLLWSLAGHAWVEPAGRRRTGLQQAMIELPEDVLQLLVNTVSFVRVGAFALAHSGLSAAVVELASVVENAAGQLFILVLGNTFVIVLEGLVVGIQTTRLVLFEFFIRFLRGEGRPFQPLPAPLLSADKQLRSHL